MFLPFAPTLSASTSQLAGGASATFLLPVGGNTLRLLLSGTGLMAFKLGASDVTAAATDTPMLGNTVETFQKGAATHCAVIAISGTPTLYVTSGNGE